MTTTHDVKINVISLWQPWASLVVHGLKRFETRSWAAKVYGPIAIHAAKKWTKLQYELCQTEPFIRAINIGKIDCLRRGAIVGIVSVKHCYRADDAIIENYLRSHPNEEAFGDFGAGRFAWQIEEAYAFKNPVEEKGRQGYWSIETARLPEIDWHKIIAF